MKKRRLFFPFNFKSIVFLLMLCFVCMHFSHIFTQWIIIFSLYSPLFYSLFFLWRALSSETTAAQDVFPCCKKAFLFLGKQMTGLCACGIWRTVSEEFIFASLAFVFCFLYVFTHFCRRVVFSGTSFFVMAALMAAAMARHSTTIQQKA